MKNFTPPL